MKKIYMSKINFNITVTYSKFIALLILIVGSVLSIIIKSETLMIATFTAVSALIVSKQYNDRKNPYLINNNKCDCKEIKDEVH